jgi:hypothetical protein
MEYFFRKRDEKRKLEEQKLEEQKKETERKKEVEETRTAEATNTEINQIKKEESKENGYSGETETNN